MLFLVFMVFIFNVCLNSPHSKCTSPHLCKGLGTGLSPFTIRLQIKNLSQIITNIHKKTNIKQIITHKYIHSPGIMVSNYFIYLLYTGILERSLAIYIKNFKMFINFDLVFFQRIYPQNEYKTQKKAQCSYYRMIRKSWCPHKLGCIEQHVRWY